MIHMTDLKSWRDPREHSPDRIVAIIAPVLAVCLVIGFALAYEVIKR